MGITPKLLATNKPSLGNVCIQISWLQLRMLWLSPPQGACRSCMGLMVFRGIEHFGPARTVAILLMDSTPWLVTVFALRWAVVRVFEERPNFWETNKQLFCGTAVQHLNNTLTRGIVNSFSRRHTVTVGTCTACNQRRISMCMHACIQSHNN